MNDIHTTANFPVLASKLVYSSATLIHHNHIAPVFLKQILSPLTVLSSIGIRESCVLLEQAVHDEITTFCSGSCTSNMDVQIQHYLEDLLPFTARVSIDRTEDSFDHSRKIVVVRLPDWCLPQDEVIQSQLASPFT